MGWILDIVPPERGSECRRGGTRVYLLSIAIIIVTAAAMEAIAWAEHKYIMHGFLWILHEDHHKPIRKGLQLNDLFVLLFAIPSFMLIFFGLLHGKKFLPEIGLGMAVYGICYVLFHDVMFHKRLKRVRLAPKGAYFQAIMSAHRLHHRQNGKSGGLSFGFLYAPIQYADPSRWPPLAGRGSPSGLEAAELGSKPKK